MDQQNLKDDIIHEQKYPTRKENAESRADSDCESIDSSSTTASEDECSDQGLQNAVGTPRPMSTSNLDGVSTESGDVSLEPFVHQVGGRIPMVCLDADTVCKPLIEREHRFYKSLPESLKRFTPQFEGLMHIEMQANPDGCIALTGNPPFSRRKLSDLGNKQCNHRRGSRRMKNRQKLHLLLQHLHSGEKGVGSHEFEWTSSKDKANAEHTTLQNTRQNLGTNVYEKSRFINETNYNTTRDGDKELGDAACLNKQSNKASDVNEKSLPPNESSEDLELFYNPWALKCHQEHFKKLGLKSPNTIAISPNTEKTENVETFPRTRCTYLLLENLVSSQIRPCVLDLKVGTRQYPDDCSSAKKKSKMAKSAQTTSATLGLRLCGMQVFNTALGRFICLNKYHGRTLNDKTFIDSIGQFLNRNQHEDQTHFRDDVRAELIQKLLDLKDELKELNSFRFYTSSLLVTYDGYCNHDAPQQLHDSSVCISFDANAANCSGSDDAKRDNFKSASANSDTLSCPFNKGAAVSSCNLKVAQSACQLDVRLIDFAHATHIGMHDKTTYEGPDDNLIYGISNFIKVLEEL